MRCAGWVRLGVGVERKVMGGMPLRRAQCPAVGRCALAWSVGTLPTPEQTHTGALRALAPGYPTMGKRLGAPLASGLPLPAGCRVSER